MPDIAQAQVVVDLLDGFRASKALFTAVDMRLFDCLHKAPATTGQLAEEFGCVPHALERLLGFCASQGLIEKRSGGGWVNLPPAERFLRHESPETLTGYILYSDRILYRLWSKLGDAVQEGTNRWEQEFGAKEGIFDHFFSTDEDKETFMNGMHGLGLLCSPSVVAAHDLSRFRKLVDVGGGTGHLAIEACRRYPELRATVFDLAAVTPLAERRIAEAGLSDRVDTAAGDFFQDPLPECDLISLARILHDWSEEKVEQLLARVHQVLPAGGGLLIVERLLNDDKCGPANPLLQSLSMLVCTEGRERSAPEYEALVRQAGFSSFEAFRTGTLVDAMLAIK